MVTHWVSPSEHIELGLTEINCFPSLSVPTEFHATDSFVIVSRVTVTLFVVRLRFSVQPGSYGKWEIRVFVRDGRSFGFEFAAENRLRGRGSRVRDTCLLAV